MSRKYTYGQIAARLLDAELESWNKEAILTLAEIALKEGNDITRDSLIDEVEKLGSAPFENVYIGGDYSTCDTAETVQWLYDNLD